MATQPRPTIKTKNNTTAKPQEKAASRKQARMTASSSVKGIGGPKPGSSIDGKKMGDAMAEKTRNMAIRERKKNG